VSEGEQWNHLVWVKGDEGARDQLIQKLNGLLNQFDITVRRGFQRYDPVVITGAALTYKRIVDDVKGQGDGGVAYAQAFRDWYSGVTPLQNLPRALQALAVITHWAEVARGYKSALAGLYAWIDEIASAGSREEARGVWAQYNERYPPSLTYKQDVAADFELDAEMDELERQQELSDEEGLGEISSMEVEELRKDAQPDLRKTRLRSGKK
jgi:hypothetical protein